MYNKKLKIKLQFLNVVYSCLLAILKRKRQEHTVQAQF